MKNSVKYGLLLSALIVVLKLVLSFTNLELRLAVPELVTVFVLFTVGLILSIHKTQTEEYQGAANPMELLKAGFATSALFALSFALVSLLVKILTHDLPPSTASLLMGLLFFFVFILIIGGLLSVFIAYFMSKKK